MLYLFFLIPVSLFWRITPSLFLSNPAPCMWLGALPPLHPAWVQGPANLVRLYHHPDHKDWSNKGRGLTQPLSVILSDFAGVIWKHSSHCGEGCNESGWWWSYFPPYGMCLPEIKETIHRKPEKR